MASKMISISLVNLLLFAGEIFGALIHEAAKEGNVYVVRNQLLHGKDPNELIQKSKNQFSNMILVKIYWLSDKMKLDLTNINNLAVIL